LIYVVTEEDKSKLPEFEYISWGAANTALHGSTYLYVDIETTGLNFLSDTILSIQVSDGENEWVYLTKDSQDKIPELFSVLNSARMLVGHNLKFDLKFLKARGYDISIPIYDTMLCEQVLVNGTLDRAGLLPVALKYCGVELNKGIRSQFALGKDLTPAQIIYAADDVKYLRRIMEAQVEELKFNELTQIAKLECEAAIAFIDIEFNGLEIDVDRWMGMIEVLRGECKDVVKDLNHMIDQDTMFKDIKAKSFQTDMFLSEAETRGTHMNWDSSVETLKVFKCVDPAITSTAEKEAYRIGRLHPIGKMVRKYREKSKKVSSFGTSFLKNIYAEDGKIHPSFTQIKRTGRVSCKEPNVQQIPANNDWRNCFITDPGHVFVSADYSSQELCIIAHGSKDPVFNEALSKGHDLHSVCAKLVFGKVWDNAALDDCIFNTKTEKCSCPKHKDLRTTVKTINFGLAYGMGPHRLAETMNSTVKEAETLISKYFKAFPRIEVFLDRMASEGVSKGYIKTFSPWKRTRWFPDWQPVGMEFGTRKKIERVSKNTPIQGTAADMTKHALILCQRYIKENNLPVKLVMTVHDQIDTTCEKSFAAEWSLKLKELMEKAAEHIMGNTLLKADVEITNQWSK